MTKITEYVGTDPETGEPADFFRVLELPERGAPFNPNEVVFMDFGTCKGMNPALFDTNTAKGKTSMRGRVTIGGHLVRKQDVVGLAKRVCAACPVRNECRSFIMKYPEQEGIWAGLLPEERGQA